jgi:hypothetical protein
LTEGEKLKDDAKYVSNDVILESALNPPISKNKSIEVRKLKFSEPQLTKEETLKRKSVEDLLEIEYLTVKHALPGQNGLKKISEGRLFKPIQGYFDSLSDEERNDEINYLQSLSLQFQSLLYAEISKHMKPFQDNDSIPIRLQNTEVSLIVDINSSMITLDHSKLIGAQVLSTGITSILSSFGILINMYVFADREAIWKINDLSQSAPFLDLLHLVDALRIGGRPGSFPLDALLSSQSEWEEHRITHFEATQGVDNHFNIRDYDCC